MFFVFLLFFFYVQTACETFCLEDDVNIDDVSATLRRDLITSDTVRFAPVANLNSQEKNIHDNVAGELYRPQVTARIQLSLD